MSRRLAAATCALALALTTAACGGGGGSSSSPAATSPVSANGLPAPEGVVRVLAREGYTEDSWIIPFQDQTGCRVDVHYLGPGDDTQALLSQGSYDVVTLASEDLPAFAAARIIRPIDPTFVPHFKTLRQGLRGVPALVRGGALLGVPFQWGPNLLIWNTKTLAHAPISWNALYLKRNNGRVSIPDDPIQIADAALLAEAQHPSLHIRSPFQLSEKQLRAALKLLKRQKALTPSRWGAASDQVDAFVNGAAALGAGWSYVARSLRKQGIPARGRDPARRSHGLARLLVPGLDRDPPRLRLPLPRLLDEGDRPGQDIKTGRRRTRRARRMHAPQPAGLPLPRLRRRLRHAPPPLPHNPRHVMPGRPEVHERPPLASRLEPPLALRARSAGRDRSRRTRAQDKICGTRQVA